MSRLSSTRALIAASTSNTPTLARRWLWPCCSSNSSLVRSDMADRKSSQHNNGASADRRRQLQTGPRGAVTSRSRSNFQDHSCATSRLSLISRHLQQYPSYQLNTPYSTERAGVREDEFDGTAQYPDLKPEKAPSKSINFTPTNPAMSIQEEHPTILIPGPIEYDDEVLKSMSHHSESHVGMPFVNTFADVLTMLRKVLHTSNPNSQPFVISGSGTLGWDQVAANLAEKGDDALVLHTGYFGDSFADCFEAYGVNATQLKAPIGDRPQLPEIEKALKEKKYKILTVTHVDTSTGVLSEIKNLTQKVREVSPETLVVVDGVCSVGAEEIRFDDWDLDIVMTASQKALGCPAGLSILMASERAMNVFKNRKTPPASYFASWKNWLPILQNYEARKPSYFATPSPQLIHALHTSLTQMLKHPMQQRFDRHRAVGDYVQKHVEQLGLGILAADPANRAATMTAIWLPEGVTAAEFLPGLLKKGVVFAGGLHKEIATKYVRFGHMGVSATDPNRDDVKKALKAFEERLAEVGYNKGQGHKNGDGA